MSKQWEAIDAVMDACLKHPQVQAMFLKGSLAKGTGDDFSDVDFYCLVDEGGEEGFLSERLNILRSYRPLIYWSEANYVAPQIVAVFDNGLHFDLYTVTENRFPLVGGFKVLYDPGQRLEQFRDRIREPRLSKEQVETRFGSFSFTLLEFEAAWRRDDLTWATRLASHLSGDLAVLMRHLYDPSEGQLGMKRLEALLPEPVRGQWRQAIEECSLAGLPKGVVLLCQLLKDTCAKLQDREELDLDWRLFEYMYVKIKSLAEG